MNNLLEHVDDPVELLENCKRHLAKGGRLIAQVPNCESITRRLGVLMGVIGDISDISEKERDFYGHQRIYTLKSLEGACREAGLKVMRSVGILYKPLPNLELEYLCQKNGEAWTERFLKALVKFGEKRPTECAYLFVKCG